MGGGALLSALAVGVGAGLLGRLALRGPKAAPVWLTVALGVAAALLGSVIARLLGMDLDDRPYRLVAQVGLALPAVVLGVVAAGRRRAPERGEPAGGPGDGDRLRDGRTVGGQA